MNNTETEGTVAPESSGSDGADYHQDSIANNPLDRALAEDYLVPESVAGLFQKPVRILTVIAAFFMLSIAAVTIVDVTGRYVFNSPIPGGVEVIEFLLGLTIFSSLPLVTVKRAHITVELFDGMMSDGFKRVREFIVLVASAAMIIFITHRMWSTGLDMLENDDISLHLEVPTAPILFVLCGLSAISAVTQIYMVWKYVTEDIRQGVKPHHDHHQEEDVI